MDCTCQSLYPGSKRTTRLNHNLKHKLITISNPNLNSISDLQLIFNIKPTFDTRPTSNITSTSYSAKSLTYSGVGRFGLSIFIFYSVAVILERVNLVTLLGSVGAC